MTTGENKRTASPCRMPIANYLFVWQLIKHPHKPPTVKRDRMNELNDNGRAQHVPFMLSRDFINNAQINTEERGTQTFAARLCRTFCDTLRLCGQLMCVLCLNLKSCDVVTDSHAAGAMYKHVGGWWVVDGWFVGGWAPMLSQQYSEASELRWWWWRGFKWWNRSRFVCILYDSYGSL